MSFDMPFYENDNYHNLKGRQSLDPVHDDEMTAVAAMVGDWRDQTLDIESLLASRNQLNSQHDQSHRVPDSFSNQPPTTSRPSVLNINCPVKEEPNAATDAGQQSPYSHPMYRQQRSPVSPCSSPYSPASSRSYVSPVSPANSGSLSTISPVSPHMRAGSTSPHQAAPCPTYFAPPVFGRYTGPEYPANFSSCEMNTNFREEKNGEIYRLKRERNNIAVRRSREKKKQREVENEQRVFKLTEENNELQNRLEVVVKEMKLLRSLYKNIGVSLPLDARHKIESEISKLDGVSF